MASNSSGGALAGLAGHYGSDSEEDADPTGHNKLHGNAQRSMWSMCVDPNTGCPYYWDQITNQVSWELPPGVVITSSSAMPGDGVCNSKTPGKIIMTKKPAIHVDRACNAVKISQRSDLPSSDEEEKIELITSYYNSDSGSGDENIDQSVKQNKSSHNNLKHKNVRQTILKKAKNIISAQPYGPELPDSLKTSTQQLNVNYLSKEKMKNDHEMQKSDDLSDTQQLSATNSNTENETRLLCTEANDSVNCKINNKNENGEPDSNIIQKPSSLEVDNLDDLMLVQANLLKKLGELGPSEIKYLNGSKENSLLSNSRTQSPLQSPIIATSPGSHKKSTALDMDVDDLIAQIEMEQPIDQPAASDVSSTGNIPSQDGSMSNKSTSVNENLDQKSNVSFKPLFPCANFTSVLDTNIVQKRETDESEKNDVKDTKMDISISNKYELSTNVGEGIENSAFKRKRRIALDILPAKKSNTSDENLFKRDLPYTMKYAQNNEISGERVGLGFSTDIDDDTKKFEDKNSYPNFKRGDSLVFHKANECENSANPDKGNNCTSNKNSETDKDLETMKNLIELKLKFLVQNLSAVSPVQQLYIELHTLWGALTSGALQKDFILEWLHTADTTLARLEASAAPHPWICRFHSGAGCYVYEHAETGKIQWEHPENETPQPPPTPPPVKPPAPPSPLPNEPTDMDISTTPPPQSHDVRTNTNVEHAEPLPPGVETPTRINSPHLLLDNSKLGGNEFVNDFKQVDSAISTVNPDKLVAEIDSFYSVIAALEDTPTTEKIIEKDNVPTQVIKQENITKNNVTDTPVVKEKKKKSKIKTPNTMKDKTVSKLVEKWKKVQETIHD